MHKNLKYGDLISKMTLEEKTSLLSGANFWNTKAIDRLGIPSIMMTDGPHGLRKQGGKADHLGLNKSVPATCFPTAACLANSWDLELMKRVGTSIAEEAKYEGISAVLGPGLNIKRNPLCGRNFEYFSEDPYLAGKMAGALTTGIQSTGVSACLKHFAVNSQEHLRMTIDEVVDERTLRELYLEGFRIAVEEANPDMIMTSYNRVNGTYANENRPLLTDILMVEWKFNGVVVSDWGGNNDRVEALIAGSHLEMPASGGINDQKVAMAVQDGILDENLLDLRVDHLLNLVFKKILPPESVDYKAHHNMAVDAAANSMVLLKNEGQILPLKPDKTIGIIGAFAKIPRYQGAGSSLIEPTEISNVLQSIKQSNLKISGYAPGFKRFGGSSNKLKKQAVELAKKSEIVLLFVGLDEASEAEGVDRNHMRLNENQLEIIRAIREVNSEIVVVLSGGAPIELPFEPEVKGILLMSLAGQGSGEAVVKILIGEVNPSGKLAETYPVTQADVLSSNYYPGLERAALHKEGLYVGYRYFETVNKPVRFPFGFGLSYTSFMYSDFVIKDKVVQFKLTNTGAKFGKEIVQLYVKPFESKVHRPKIELKRFDKISLQPGESKLVSFILDDRCFEIYSVAAGRWGIPGGKYDICIGSSIQSLPLKWTVEMEGNLSISELERDDVNAYRNLSVESITDSAFEQLLGRPLPPLEWDKHAPLDLDDVIIQAQHKGLLSRILVKSLMGLQKSLMFFGKPLIANNIYFILNMPFRSLSRFSQGRLREESVSKWIRRL
ncbi:MAG: glycoside hydrolase family 3 C-terminal domain-containing protein [Bacillota bacterium]|nr:glycoside hydrolase family 3 C-terminal domain-containing protein [Bacillota bacterium]